MVGGVEGFRAAAPAPDCLAHPPLRSGTLPAALRAESIVTKSRMLALATALRPPQPERWHGSGDGCPFPVTPAASAGHEHQQRGTGSSADRLDLQLFA